MCALDNQSQPDTMNPMVQPVSPLRDASRIVLIYLVMGMLWIFFSDKLIAWLSDDIARYQQAQLVKGWIYIALSGAVFFMLLYGNLKVIERSACRIVQDNQRLHDLAYFDHLTLLPNRIMLNEQGAEVLRKAEATGSKVYLCFLDVDNFKHINETMTHAAGDALLRHLAAHLASDLLKDAHVFRLGGDEFAVMLSDDTEAAVVHESLATMKQRLEAPWEYQGQSFHMTMSVGVAVFPEHGRQIDDLCRNADAALAYVKEHGKNGITIFNEGMQVASWTYLNLFNGLQKAIASKQFTLHFQPIFDLKTQQVHNLEALIRWPDPQRGFISPLEFIPFSEGTGQICAITEWVIRQVGMLQHETSLPEKYSVPVTVNLSAVVLRHPSFQDMIERVEKETALECGKVLFEITETAAVHDFVQTVSTLQWLRERGYKILLDDFGTGYSSLTYLQKLPIDHIKIDRSFIHEITTRTDHQMMFRSIIDLAHHIGLTVVAEGIETQEQLDFVRQYGCDYAQGYLLAKPKPIEDF